MHKQIVVWIVFAMIAFVSIPLHADTKGQVPIKRVADSVSAQITAISGNTITIADNRGNKKTLLLDSTRGLTVGTKTGWCEEDCGRIKIGDQSIRVQRVIESNS